MAVNELCKDIMSNTSLPMSKRVELVREIRILGRMPCSETSRWMGRPQK